MPGCFWFLFIDLLLRSFLFNELCMEQRLARSRCYERVFVLSTFFTQVPFTSYKSCFLLSIRL